MRSRRGPAAVWGDASAQYVTGASREDGADGSPEPEDLTAAAQRPLVEGGIVHIRLLLAFGGTLLVAVALAATAVAGTDVNVTVRVEGKTRNLFGATAPSLVPAQGSLAAEADATVEVTRPTVLGALETASLVGEFNYNLKVFSFGSFVDRVGRFGSAGLTGWFFKVNGRAPQVGANDVVLKNGDSVLWYWTKLDSTTFAGPDTLKLVRKRGCFVAQAVNANGKAKRAKNVVFRLDERRRIRSKSGRLCTSNWESARVVKRGLIRSQVLVPAV